MKLTTKDVKVVDFFLKSLRNSNLFRIFAKEIKRLSTTKRNI